MIRDARSVARDAVLDAEVCIVGAGAAGITLARAFIDSPFRVIVLESGGMNYEPATQALYAGTSIGRSFDWLTTSRLRFFGGTTNHWGGWCLPLDTIDFEPRKHFPYHGWPFQKSTLDPWYRQAQGVCGLGPFDYRPASWGITPSMIPAPFAGPNFDCEILQVSTKERFGSVYAAELRRAPRVSVFLQANAFAFRRKDGGSTINACTVKTLTGNRFFVRSRIYILAAGGIENARLLLAGSPDGNGLGNEHDLVGRFFMVHLVYSGGKMVPTQPRMTFAFRSAGQHRFGGKKYPFVSIIGVTDATMRARALPNIFISWGYQFSPVVHSVDAFHRMLDGEPNDGDWLGDLRKVVGNLEGVADFGVRKLLFGESIPIESMTLSCASEQQPNPESRILLGSKRDALGMPEVEMDWHLVPEDEDGAAKIIQLLSQEVGRAGFARLRPSLTPGGHWPANLYGNEHQMGTTRMHRDPKKGVVDENCRVHSVPNLYVAGSSVFPTGGANNPTLTIVALALRLADHLKRVLA